MAIKKVMKLIQIDTRIIDGCDISYYQGDIDFEVMKTAGIKAVIIRAGYGTVVDKRFISYINGAIKAGLAIGVYWFIYAGSSTRVKQNAWKCIEVITPYKDYITCGIWSDWEYDSDRYAGTLTSEERSCLVDTFNVEIEKVGYEAGIYSNQDYIQSGKFQSWLVANYPLWFAKYSFNIGNYATKGKQGRPYLWQYSSSGNGSAYGVSSRMLDLNKVYIDFAPDAVVPPVDNVTKDTNRIKASDNPYLKPTRTIYYTTGKSLMYGDDVKWVQWHLWRCGLFLDKDGNADVTQIDGRWGPASDKALNIAQGKLKLQQDGKCGTLTRQAFERV